MTDVAGGLITLEYALTGLGYPMPDASTTARDADITAYIQAATPVIESLVGPVLQQTKTILADGGKTGVLLTGRIPNAAAVTAVRVDGGAWSGYTVNADSGVIYAGPTWAGMRFPPGIRNVEIDVTVGYPKTAPASTTITYSDGSTLVFSRTGDIVTVVATPVTPQFVSGYQPLPAVFTPKGNVLSYQFSSGTGYSTPGNWFLILNEEPGVTGGVGVTIGTGANGPFLPFTAQWLADPSAGGSLIPQGLQFAARELVRHWVQIGKQAPAGGQLNLLPDSSADPTDPYAIPRRVRQLCAAFAGGGFA